MDIIITGGTSFIGLAVIRRMIGEGHHIWAIVRPESANRDKLPKDERVHIIPCSLEYIDQLANLPETAPLLESLPTYHSTAGGGQGSLEQNKDKPYRAIHGRVFLHMAWDGIGSAGRMDREIQEKNIENSMKALKAAEELCCCRFIFSGSQAEYGVHRAAATEETPCHPVSEYGRAKLEFGRRAAKACGQSALDSCLKPEVKGEGSQPGDLTERQKLSSLKMEYVHCRIFSVYGPGDHPWSLVNSCLKTFEAGGHMDLGECTQQWNFLYIDDMAEAIAALLLKKERIQGIYNIAARDTRVLREFVEEVYEICGKKGSFSYGKRPFNAEGPASLIPDIHKIEQATGWRPAVSFREGIEKTRRSLI
ncbi:NAD(P)-dependent oxidoreductase [Lachnospiraceae bacterium 62-35]